MREGVFVPDLTRSGVRVRGLGLVWTSGPTRSVRDQHQTRSRTRHRNLTGLVSYDLLTSLISHASRMACASDRSRGCSPYASACKSGWPDPSRKGRSGNVRPNLWRSSLVQWSPEFAKASRRSNLELLNFVPASWQAITLNYFPATTRQFRLDGRSSKRFRPDQIGLGCFMPGHQNHPHTARVPMTTQPESSCRLQLFLF